MTADDGASEAGPAGVLGPRRLWLDIGLWIAVLPIAASAVRILLYSGGDPTLLRVLIETLDVITVLLGTLLPILPLLVGAAIFPLLADMSLARRLVTEGSPLRRRIMITALVAALALWVLLSPWPTATTMILSVPVGLALAAAGWYIWTFARWLTAGHTVRRSVREASRIRFSIGTQEPVGRIWHVAAIPAFMLVLVFTLPFGMWLPKENIVTSADSMTGYVLQVTEEWTTIVDDERTVTIVRSDNVTSREVCGQGDFESLLTLLWGANRPDGPSCEA